MKRVLFFALTFLSAGCSKQVERATEAIKSAREPRETKLPAAEISKLASQGFSQFECAAYASFAGEKDKIEPLFNKGRDSLTRFVETAKTIKNEAKVKAVNNSVPMIVLENLGGPSTDFMIGHVWGATMLYVEDQLYDRSGWTHQKNDPKADAPDAELVKVKAENRFREANCDLL